MKIHIYLALQTFKDGRAMYRRWSPQIKTSDFAKFGIKGGAFEPQSDEAGDWLDLNDTPVWDSRLDSTCGGEWPTYAPYQVIDCEV